MGGTPTKASGAAKGHSEGSFHLNRGLFFFSASSGGTKHIGVKGTMFTACKSKVAGGWLPPHRLGQSLGKAHSTAQPPFPQSLASPVAGPRHLWDSSGETPAWGGTEKENGFSYVGLMILLHVHICLAGVLEVIQGEELPREPQQWSLWLGLLGHTATEGP